MKRQIREELGEKLSIPPEVMGSLPLTQVHGRRNVSIENHGGILAYTDTCVRVAVRGGAVSVQGSPTMHFPHIPGEICEQCAIHAAASNDILLPFTVKACGGQ